MSLSSLLNWFYVNASLATAIASTIVAACALCATVYNAFATRKHNRLSVMPYLTTWESINGDEVVFKIQNHGVGPARINSFDIFVDGQKLTGEKLEKHEKCLKIIFSEYPFTWYGSYLGVDYMMPANQEVALAGIKFTTHKRPSPAELNNIIQRVKVLIHYESIYEDKIVFDSIEEAKKQLSSQH